MFDISHSEKRKFLGSFISNNTVVDEILSYFENKFKPVGNSNFRDDEPLIETYSKYLVEGKSNGYFNTLKKKFVQLQFAIRAGQSKTSDYKRATLKGEFPTDPEYLILSEPEKVHLELHQNDLVSKVPIITVANHSDFKMLVFALLNKNEPMHLPPSMGAVFINGLNNWDRIHQLKNQWLTQNPNGNWAHEFRENVLPNTNLYKDKIIILTQKEYSAVKSDSLSLAPKTWLKHSMAIRKEHECAHLFTLKHYGNISINLHDEIIADYAGITKLLGSFNSRWFLFFMGLESYPTYRFGGRLENYIGNLSPDSFKHIVKIVSLASTAISEFDSSTGKIKDAKDRINRIRTLCETDVVSMACLSGREILEEKYNSISKNSQLCEVD